MNLKLKDLFRGKVVNIVHAIGIVRIVPRGSIPRVVRESIEAAAQYMRVRHAPLQITAG
jgi:hypothetical protein